MKITLVNFRCYRNHVFNFPDYGITLLKGKSGRGKTTIQNAIYFCLYGKMKKVTTPGQHGCSVTCEFGPTQSGVTTPTKDDRITVQRTKKPDAVTVEFKGQLYRDDTAQEIINAQFGPVEIFECASYLKQNERNKLISETNSTKLSIITNLAYSEQEAEILKNTLHQTKDSYNNQKIQTETAYNMYSNDMKMYLQQYSQANSAGSMLISMEDLQSIRTTVENQQKELQVISQKKRENDNRIMMKKSLENSLLTLQNALPIVDTTQKEKLVVEQQQLQSLIQQINLQIQQMGTEKQQKIKSNDEYIILQQRKTQQKSNYDRCLSNLTTISDGLYQQQTSQKEAITNSINEKKQEQNKLREYHTQALRYFYHKQRLETLKNQISSMGLDKFTSISDIMMEMEKIKNDIGRQEKVNDYHQQIINTLKGAKGDTLSQLKEKIESHRNNITSFNNETQRLQNECNTLKQQLNSSTGLKVNCPKCNGDLLLRNNELYITQENSPTTLTNKILETQKGLQYYSQQLTLASSDIVMLQRSVESIEILKVKLQELNLPVNVERVTELKIYLEKLSQLHKVYVEYELLQKQSIIDNGHGDADELTKKIEETQKICDTLQSQLVSITGEIAKTQSIINNNNNLTYQMDTISKSIQNIDLELQNKMDHSELIKKIDKDIQDANSNIKIFNEQYSKISMELSNLKSQIENRDRVQKNIDQIQQQLLSIIIESGVSEKEQELIKSISSGVEMYNLQTQRFNYQQKEIKTKEMYEQLMHVSNKITSLDKLSKLLNDGIHLSLMTTIDNINNTLTSVLENVFNDPIVVELSAFVELKTQKRIKPTINLKIQYKGLEYDQVNHMSGGEADRVSLCFSVALNKISNSRICLLDECLSSLDPEIKKAAIFTLKNQLSSPDGFDASSTMDKSVELPTGTRSCPIIMIDHSCVEGYFDHVIDLDKILG
jgi:exonuclease SbcC